MRSRIVVATVLGITAGITLAGCAGVLYLRSPQGTELRHQIVAIWSAAGEQPHDTAPEAVAGARVQNQLGVNTFLEREADPEKRRDLSQDIAGDIVVAAMTPRRVFYGWIIVGAGILVTCMGLGAMFSLSVFLKPISESMG